MPAKVKLTKGFCPGTYAEVRAWFDANGINPDEMIVIAPNTSIRLTKCQGKWACVYKFYYDDILILISDGSIVINSNQMSSSTKRRINQFLAPLNCSVRTKAGVDCFITADAAIPFTKEAERFKL